MSAEEPRSAVRMLLSGRVQGVGFRYFTRGVATELGLTGWVRNLAGGEVEVAVAGGAPALEEFRRLLRQGPPGARVDELREWELAEPPAASGFEITY